MEPLSEAKSYKSEASISLGCQTETVSLGALDSAAKAYTRAMSTQYNRNDTPSCYSFDKGVQCSTKPKLKNAVSCGTQTSLKNRNKVEKLRDSASDAEVHARASAALRQPTLADVNLLLNEVKSETTELKKAHNSE
jgi:hypothetical protein